MLVISSAHSIFSIDSFDSIKKFEVIFHYNATKCGLDVIEKMITETTT